MTPWIIPGIRSFRRHPMNEAVRPEQCRCKMTGQHHDMKRDAVKRLPYLAAFAAFAFAAAGFADLPALAFALLRLP